MKLELRDRLRGYEFILLGLVVQPVKIRQISCVNKWDLMCPLLVYRLNE